MRVLDLFCGAGGAAVGYARAGAEVIGVDIDPQPSYPYEFIQADALEVLERVADGRLPRPDLIHASPPCQAHSALTAGNREREGWVDEHVDLIPDTRRLLDATGLPYVIENVQGSTLRRDLTLCGEMFGLGVIRHRYFELGGWHMPKPAHLPHRGRVSGWRHGEFFEGPYVAVYGKGGGKASVEEAKTAMGIEHMRELHDLVEAIPPAYTEHVMKGFLER